MKRIWNVALTFCAAGMLSYAANWNAKLLDANCLSSSTTRTVGEKPAKACAPTDTTTSFAIEARGKTLKLDPAGNEMVAVAIKSGNIKPDKDGDVHVNVQGTAQGDMIKVDSVIGGKHTP